MEIRDARPADAGAIQRVLVDSCRAAYADVLKDPAFIHAVEEQDVDELRDWLAENGGDDDVIYLVGEQSTDAGQDSTESDSIRGFAQLLAGSRRPDHLTPGTAFLKSLYVVSDHWGEGMGSALLDEGIERLPEETERLELAVLASNDLGKGFYDSYGFELVDDGSIEVGGVTYETDVYAMAIE